MCNSNQQVGHLVLAIQEVSLSPIARQQERQIPLRAISGSTSVTLLAMPSMRVGPMEEIAEAAMAESVMVVEVTAAGETELFIDT
jgi:hypothetical protein